MVESPQATHPPPLVRLVNAFPRSLDNAVATARTCYSPRIITEDEVAMDHNLRDRLAASIYQAGHHTTLQHASFQFTLERVSRQFLWSFLHAHPFYNSEQVSQRYVEVRPGNLVTPLLPPRAVQIYHDATRAQMNAYQELSSLVGPTVRAEYARLFPKRNQESRLVRSAVKKRCQEAARYVLPVATHAHLYHTISGITLHRYQRLCQQLDLPIETRQVVEAMVHAVRRVEPEFLQNLQDPIPTEETPEYQYLVAASVPIFPGDPSFLDQFDKELGGRASRLVGYLPHGEERLAQAVRAVLGLARERLEDRKAIDLVMDPSRNPLLGQSLNLSTLGKLSRALSHLHLCFRKKLSHSADSQDQRHRMVPGSRPVLSRVFLPDRPDFIVPVPIASSPQALDRYHLAMDATWRAIRELLEEGASPESALYLLPNAFPIRFEESGELIHLHHKWTTRLCLNSQEEIWRATVEEVDQVSEVFPSVGRYLLPPCGLRRRSKKRPYCPEGDRYCGVPAWRGEMGEMERII